MLGVQKGKNYFRAVCDTIRRPIKNVNLREAALLPHRFRTTTRIYCDAPLLLLSNRAQEHIPPVFKKKLPEITGLLMENLANKRRVDGPEIEPHMADDDEFEQDNFIENDFFENEMKSPSISELAPLDGQINYAEMEGIPVVTIPKAILLDENKSVTSVNEKGLELIEESPLEENLSTEKINENIFPAEKIPKNSAQSRKSFSNFSPYRKSGTPITLSSSQYVNWNSKSEGLDGFSSNQNSSEFKVYRSSETKISQIKTDQDIKNKNYSPSPEKQIANAETFQSKTYYQDDGEEVKKVKFVEYDSSVSRRPIKCVLPDSKLANSESLEKLEKIVKEGGLVSHDKNYLDVCASDEQVFIQINLFYLAKT